MLEDHDRAWQIFNQWRARKSPLVSPPDLVPTDSQGFFFRGLFSLPYRERPLTNSGILNSSQVVQVQTTASEASRGKAQTRRRKVSPPQGSAVRLEALAFSCQPLHCAAPARRSSGGGEASTMTDSSELRQHQLREGCKALAVSLH